MNGIRARVAAAPAPDVSPGGDAPMLKIIRITGQSMAPLYRDGDYALLWTARPRRFKARDIVAFRHPRLGLLFKRIERVNPGGSVDVRGLHPHSVDSRTLGSVPYAHITGKVILGIRAPRG